MSCGPLAIFLILQIAFAYHLQLYWGNEKVSLGLHFCLYLLLGLCKRAGVQNFFGTV